MATMKRQTKKEADVDRLARFALWVVERAEEELERPSLPGSTASFLDAVVRDGRKLVGEDN